MHCKTVSVGCKSFCSNLFLQREGAEVFLLKLFLKCRNFGINFWSCFQYRLSWTKPFTKLKIAEVRRQRCHSPLNSTGDMRGKNSCSWHVFSGALIEWRIIIWWRINTYYSLSAMQCFSGLQNNFKVQCKKKQCILRNKETKKLCPRKVCSYVVSLSSWLVAKSEIKHQIFEFKHQISEF